MLAKALKANGKAQKISVKVTKGKKPVLGAAVKITGPGITKTVKTGKNGKVAVTFKPGKPGIIKVVIQGAEACNTQRIGVVGVYDRSSPASHADRPGHGNRASDAPGKPGASVSYLEASAGVRRYVKPSNEALAPPEGRLRFDECRLHPVLAMVVPCALSRNSGAGAGSAAPSTPSRGLAGHRRWLRPDRVGAGRGALRAGSDGSGDEDDDPSPRTTARHRTCALRRVDPATGRPTWYRITVPGGRTAGTGCIPPRAASLKPVDRWLVIYRGSRKFEFYVNGKLTRTRRSPSVAREWRPHSVSSTCRRSSTRPGPC